MAEAINPRVFLCAGEASGDAYGAALVREMLRLSPDLRFEGIGGRRLGSLFPLIASSSRWGAIGIWQSFLVGFIAIRAFWAAKRRLAAGAPGLFIAIDFGFFNIKLCRQAKRHGWKVLYFVPPGSWRRDRQGADLAGLTDAVSTPFPWSAELLRAMGANAYWYGHPLKQLVAEHEPVVRGAGVAVLPGSRSHEIDHNLPVIAQVVEGPVEFAVASSVDLARLRRAWARLRPLSDRDVFTVGDTAGVLGRARAAIVCSGTATLEAALCATPMVVMYRASKAMQIEEKLIRFKRPRFISLPNILLDRAAVPELIQETATPAAIRPLLSVLLQDGPEREAQLSAFEEIWRETGGSDAITRTAALAVGLAGG